MEKMKRGPYALFCKRSHTKRKTVEIIKNSRARKLVLEPDTITARKYTKVTGA